MSVGKIVAIVILSMALMQGGAEVARAAATAPLEIAEGHLFFAPKRTTLFVLADIWPNRTSVESISAAERESLLVTTATAIAKSLMTKPDMAALDNVRVEFSYVKNMDEYARQDFSSMVRHGYVMLARKGADLAVTESKLDFQPGR